MTDQPIEDTVDSDRTIRRELAGAANAAPESPVTGTDGKTYTPRPKPEPEFAPVDEVDTAPEVEETVETVEEPDTFPRDYVEKLRDENAKYRQRAGQADDLARRVHRLQVAATGLLADPDDLEFAEDHLDDEEALTAAIEDLLARKPHLAARRPRGDVGQGITDTGPVDLAAVLRRAAN